MKFAVLAGLIAAVASEKCDTAKLHFKVFNDPDCKELNEEATKEYTNLSKKDSAFFSGKCASFQDKYGLVYTCSAESLNADVWTNAECKGDKWMESHY